MLSGGIPFAEAAEGIQIVTAGPEPPSPSQSHPHVFALTANTLILFSTVSFASAFTFFAFIHFQDPIGQHPTLVIYSIAVIFHYPGKVHIQKD